MLIYVALSEKPLLIMTGLDHLLEKCVDLKSLQHVNIEAVLQRSRRLMSNDEVDAVAVFLQLFDTVDDLLVGGLFTLPPVLAVSAEVQILAVAAAESEDLFALYGEDFAPHKVEDMPAQPVDSAAIPFLHGKAFQQVEILMAAVHKSNSDAQLVQFFKGRALFSGAVPDKAEISANNERITALDLLHLRVLESI